MRAHQLHDGARHPLEAMAGLVLGITTVERTQGGAARRTPQPSIPTRHLRLFAQEASADSGKPARRGYVLQRGVEPRADSVEVPGTALELRTGTTYRLRFVNVLAAAAARMELVVDSLPLSWRPVAKDGADLPPAARAAVPSRLRRIGVGETFDFEWTPDRPMDAELIVRSDRSVLRQQVRVLATPGRPTAALSPEEKE